jgi:hypothetical protein
MSEPKGFVVIDPDGTRRTYNRPTPKRATPDHPSLYRWAERMGALEVKD